MNHEPRQPRKIPAAHRCEYCGEEIQCFDCGAPIDLTAFPSGYSEGFNAEHEPWPRCWPCWERAPERPGVELSAAVLRHADQLAGSTAEQLQEAAESMPYLPAREARLLTRMVRLEGIRTHRQAQLLEWLVDAVLLDVHEPLDG